MHKITTIIIFLLILTNSGYCQKNSCVDSINSYNYSGTGLYIDPYYGSPVIDNNDNVFLQSDSIDQNGNNNLSLLKLDSLNKVIFRKTYVQNSFSDHRDYTISFADRNNDIIISGGSEFNTSLNIATILKLDNSGNIKWQKTYKESGNNNNFLRQQTVSAKNEDIILFMQDNYADPNYKVCLLDGNGDVKWSKKYRTSLSSYAKNIEELSIVFNGSDIVVTGMVEDGNGSKEGFFMTRINYSDGRLVETKSNQFTDLPSRYWFPATVNYLSHFNYDPVAKKYLIAIWPDARLWSGLLEIVTDENLSPVESKVFNLDVNNPLGYTSVSRSNDLYYSYGNFSDSSFVYALINDKLNIKQQQKIKLDFYSFNNNHNSGLGVFRKYGMDILVGSSFTRTGSFLMLGNSDFYKSSCPVYDTSFLTTQDIHLGPLNFTIDLEDTLSLVVSDLPLRSVVNSNISRTNICKQVSICDSIKIIGQSGHCFDESTAIFKLYKNPLCLRKTKWMIDTSALKILNENDTILNVRFLKPFYGYIYAGFEGCTLIDSLLLNVYEKQPPVNLGRDTIFCPGKTIMFHAGKGYSKIQWQDGSNNEFYLALKPGKYSVTVTDSCGNISKDTILIKENDIRLKTNYANTLCLYDTATIFLPDNIKNYTFQPLNNAILSGNILKLFPSTASVYTVYGESFKGCPVSDTVLIKVNPCPEYFYFPNAFTPNNDGLNDQFKPAFEGHLISYELSIYNRWGQLVFKSTNVSRGWDGKINGELQSTGSYVWICRFKFINKEVQNKKGSFVLIK